MKHTIKMWKAKLEHEMQDEMKKSVSLETLSCTDKLMENWMLADDIYGRLGEYQDDKPTVCSHFERLNDDEVTKWNDNMMNVDGTKGGHWTVEQTTSVAGSISICFNHITPDEWRTAMNMMYSDYAMVAKKTNLDMATFCGEMARAFLFDKDGGIPYMKLARYYRDIVENATVY